MYTECIFYYCRCEEIHNCNLINCIPNIGYKISIVSRYVGVMYRYLLVNDTKNTCNYFASKYYGYLDLRDQINTNKKYINIKSKLSQGKIPPNIQNEKKNQNRYLLVCCQDTPFEHFIRASGLAVADDVAFLPQISPLRPWKHVCLHFSFHSSHLPALLHPLFTSSCFIVIIM